jgi:hypothetical protein
MRNSSPRLVRFIVGVPLAYLTVALFAPTPVRAGCDYATHVEYTSNDSVTPKHEKRLPSKPCPCTGPHCSRQPFVPLAPTSLPSLTMPEWGQLIPQPFLAPPASEVRQPEDTLQLPFGYVSAIYHPPRLSF